ncbi:NADP-dependent oxidoreductase domain-containing protein [Daldinia decipiens]|uniref:NADP-dependent oxidoreductase domain-containing protein n=1 Tax=Daldinia decipiens TaxID=326647 RepID=UPI0020C212A1|nr:NADP-dependent oxidoreductase domain-containing protein [Daldinia decipiens]KAI1660053.1 NADP-dependent oxidoreductase domain-containing protein [Daldinia decipiens]
MLGYVYGKMLYNTPSGSCLSSLNQGGKPTPCCSAYRSLISLHHHTSIVTIMASSEAPHIIFGCGGLGNEFVGATNSSNSSVRELLELLKEAGINRLDTAALYPPSDIGASQRLLGQVGAARLGFIIDTKVLISMSGFKGTLEPEKIAKSIAESHEALRFGDGQRINVFYPHAPDVATPLKDQAAGFHEQYKKGLFDKLGVCNFPADMLAEFIDICEREGYVKPTVHQGL